MSRATGRTYRNPCEAYETLSDGRRKTLDGLTAITTSTEADASKRREERLKSAGAEMKVLIGEHPVVRPHPEARRRVTLAGPTPR